MTDRRLLRYRLTRQQLDALQGRINKPGPHGIPGMPDDAVYLDSHHNPDRYCWDVTVWHESFPVVPGFELIPWHEPSFVVAPHHPYEPDDTIPDPPEARRPNKWIDGVLTNEY